MDRRNYVGQFTADHAGNRAASFAIRREILCRAVSRSASRLLTAESGERVQAVSNVWLGPGTGFAAQDPGGRRAAAGRRRFFDDIGAAGTITVAG
jgi:hypothetical protein